MLDQLCRGGDERTRVVESRDLRAERCDELIVARVGNRLFAVDSQDVDVRPGLVEPLAQKTRRRRLFGLDDQGLDLRRGLQTGIGSHMIPSLFAHWLTSPTCCSI